MKAKRSPVLDVPGLEATARAAVRNESFRDAIAAYKELLKRERRPEWETGLSEAYLHRARQVAAKGMFQEAVLLWENHAAHAPSADLSAEYVGWLLQAGQPVKLAQAMVSLTGPVAASPLGAQLTEAVALLALDNDKLTAALSGNHPILRDRPVVRRAIEAYAARRDEDAATALQQISSRSPYRSVRMVLKALLSREENPESTREQLARVDRSSLCRDFAEAVSRSLDEPVGGMESTDGKSKQQAVIARLSGFGKEPLALLRDAERAGQIDRPRALVELTLRHRQTLGDAVTCRLCRAALIGAPDAIPLYEKAFGKLPPFEASRTRALHAEQQRDIDAALLHWDRCLTALGKSPDDAQGRLGRALILRHKAKLCASERGQSAVRWLEESLAFDPDDKPTYLVATALAERSGDAKLAQSWLDRSLKRFPADTDILMAGLEAASRRKAFKKAAGYAKSVLQIDPIHSRARQFLLDAHLGHARKQLRAGRPDRARQEAEQARALDRQGRSAALCFIEGLVDYCEGRFEACAQRFEQGWAIAGAGLAARFQLAMETELAGTTLAAAGGPIRLAPRLEKGYLPDKPALMGLIKAIAQYREEGRPAFGRALKGLAAMLKKGLVQARLSEDDFVVLCQALADCGQFELVADCARQGLRHTPLAPGLVYFAVLANCKGDPARLMPHDERLLARAAEEAHRTGNRRASALISSFMDKFVESVEDSFGPDLDLPPGMEDVDPDQVMELLNRLMEIEAMSRDERIACLAEGGSTAPFRSLSNEQLMFAVFSKMLSDMGVDPAILGDDFPFGGAPQRGRRR